MRLSLTSAKIVLFLATFFIAMAFAGKAEAHDRGDFLPFLPTSTQKAIMQRGYGLYSMDDRTASWPGVAATIDRCMKDDEVKAGIRWVLADAGQRPDLIFYMPDTYPNDGSVGAAYYANTPSYVTVNFRAGIVQWDSTYCHELGHIHGQEDLYRHPLTCDQTVRYSVMSCGTFIGTVQPYDADIRRNVFMPDLPSEAGTFQNDTWIWIQYNSLRASAVGCQPFAGAARSFATTEKDNFCGHYSIWNDNATQVALFVSREGENYQFALDMPAPTSGNWLGFGLLKSDWCIPGVNTYFAVRPTNAMPMTWHPMHGGLSFISGDLKYAGWC